MADEVEKPEAAEAAPQEEAKPKSRRLPLILSAVVLLAGGVTAVWYLGLLPFGGKGARHAEATAAAPEEHGEAAHGPAALLALDPFIANLADDGAPRYLKATFQAEFVGGSVPPAMQAHLPQIRDLVLTLLTSKTFDDIRTPEGKEQLREEIIARMNHALDEDLVRTVYFTEFIVQ